LVLRGPNRPISSSVFLPTSAPTSGGRNFDSVVGTKIAFGFSPAAAPASRANAGSSIRTPTGSSSVEAYQPRLFARAWAELVGRTRGGGGDETRGAIRHLRSIFVPAREICSYVFGAASCPPYGLRASAGLSTQRIVEAV
jgi:hypothetical protein